MMRKTLLHRLTAASLLASAASPALAQGPGFHWVDATLSGFDAFPSVATIGIDTNLDDLMDLSLVLSGPTTIFRGNPIDTPDPLDPGHLNWIDTEIVSLNLVGGGYTVVAGDGIGNNLNDGWLFSPGAVVEQPTNPFLADSFFDVFFELQGTPYGPLHNQNALRLESVIDRVPPIGFTYTHNIPRPIGLFDIGGVERLRLVTATHTPIPEPATLILLGSGLAGMIGHGLRRRGRAA